MLRAIIGKNGEGVVRNYSAFAAFMGVIQMSVMVKKLYKNGTFLYRMRLEAGRKGLHNLVQWVHIIEDENVSSFLHGNELVFTAGILNNRQEWLLNFARRLHEAGATALVVNIGPYIMEVPQDAIAYCDEVGMPLFTIPWETKMVDMTRDFCHQIMHNENVENDTATTIKNIIFKVGDLDTQVLQMERYGFHRDSRFCFIGMKPDGAESAELDEILSRLKLLAEKTAKDIHELFISFTYQESRIIVLVDYDDAEINTFVYEFLQQVKAEPYGKRLHLGISSNQAGIYDQINNFEKALSAMEMAQKRNENVSYYDRLGIYKVLYASNDRTVLRSFYQDVIGKLEKYDRENKTRLTQLLKTYLENNGSVQLVSEKMYVHRNTVTNQLKKIETITGYNPLDLEDKVRFCMGFYIKEIC